MVLHQPPLDRFVHIVPRARVDQEEDGGEDDGKCEHKREDSCPKYKSTTRVVTTVTTHSIFNFASHPAHPQSQAGLFQTGSEEKAQLPMVDPGAAGVCICQSGADLSPWCSAQFQRAEASSITSSFPTGPSFLVGWLGPKLTPDYLSVQIVWQTALADCVSCVFTVLKLSSSVHLNKAAFKASHLSHS